MYADLTSRESTISVDSPRTPEKSFADNTPYYLPFDEDTELSMAFEERFSRLENENTEIRKMVAELSVRISKLEGIAGATGKGAKSDNIEHLLELVRSQDVNTIINNVNNCTSDKDRYSYLLDADEKKGPELLKALPAVLKENDKEGELQKKLAKGFLSMTSFMAWEAKYVNASWRVAGAANQFSTTNSSSPKEENCDNG